jgi:hypothetical protein
LLIFKGPALLGKPNRRTGRITLQKESVMKALILACVTGLALAGCTGKPALDDAKLSAQTLNMEKFFDGQLTAYGQFQDVFGTVRRRFEVQINGVWDGQTLTLTEDFVYEDGSTEQRVWSLLKTGPDTWRGTAPGVIGEATGIERGDTFNWKYTINLPVPAADGTSETIKVTFDDWMWKLSDTRLLNRAYMKRYGVDIGDVIITFEKQ